MNVIVLGVDGYIGHALTLRLLNLGHKVLGVDNGVREKNVKEMGSFSATPIDIEDRRTKMKEMYDGLTLMNFDICKNYSLLKDVVKHFQPTTIVNLAQQPSAPFSHIDREHAIYSINNNIEGTMNCLYAINEVNRNIHLIQIGSMGEYDQSLGVDIEEGVFDFKHNGRVAKNVIYPRRAPSFYHSSKIASTYFIELAVRCWNIRATDIMQGVVYGNWTPEIERTGLQTRADSDEAMGTIVNRFIIQALIGHPLTVFGSGQHSRGFLALNDSIQCLMLAIENKPNKGEYKTWNQLDEPWKALDLANKIVDVFHKHDIDASVMHIESPRVECTDEFYYNPKTDKLKELGFKPTRSLEEEIDYDINLLKDEDLNGLRKVVIPKILWGD